MTYRKPTPHTSKPFIISLTQRYYFVSHYYSFYFCICGLITTDCSHSLQDPNLWYGIGILYDRYGSFEHAEEAFTAVLKMDSKFEKANEIYFRLGIIYKQQQKNEQSLEVSSF